MLSNRNSAVASVENEPVKNIVSLDQIFQDAGFTALATELKGEMADAIFDPVTDAIRKSKTSAELVEALARVEAPIFARSILNSFGRDPGKNETARSVRGRLGDINMPNNWGELITAHRGSSDSGGHEGTFFRAVIDCLKEGDNPSSDVIEQNIAELAFTFLHDDKYDFNKWKREKALEPVFQRLKDWAGEVMVFEEFSSFGYLIVPVPGTAPNS
jgi:hypothetical protein